MQPSHTRRTGGMERRSGVLCLFCRHCSPSERALDPAVRLLIYDASWKSASQRRMTRRPTRHQAPVGAPCRWKIRQCMAYPRAPSKSGLELDDKRGKPRVRVHSPAPVHRRHSSKTLGDRQQTSQVRWKRKVTSFRKIASRASSPRNAATCHSPTCSLLAI